MIKLWIFPIFLLGLSMQAHGGEIVTVTQLDTVPNADLQDTPPTLMGDVWTFEVKTSGNVIIQVDTRDDNGDLTANLDPVAFLFDDTGTFFIESGDDDFICGRDPVCGFACPQIGPIPLEAGSYKLVVRDAGPETATGEPCNGGAYTLSVTGRVKQLKLVEDDKNVIFDPIIEKQAIRSLMDQATTPEKLDGWSEQVQILEKASP